MTADFYRKLMQKKLSSDLYEHSLATAETAVMLAERYRARREKAYLAGLVHDYGKCLQRSQLLAAVDYYSINVDIVTRSETRLLHAPVGAVLLAEELKINDRELLNAVAYHTTGCNGMTLLAKVLYLADFIEPGRSFAGVTRIRELATANLDQALLAAVDRTICSVVAKGMKLHPRSVAFRNGLLHKIQGV
jgi:predicted HD superfamily hydrolase involved in NAD metabolism